MFKLILIFQFALRLALHFKHVYDSETILDLRNQAQECRLTDQYHPDLWRLIDWYNLTARSYPGILHELNRSHTHFFDGNALDFITRIFPECWHLKDSKISSRQHLQRAVIGTLQRIIH